MPGACLNSVPCSLICHTQSTAGVVLWDFFCCRVSAVFVVLGVGCKDSPFIQKVYRVGP